MSDIQETADSATVPASIMLPSSPAPRAATPRAVERILNYWIVGVLAVLIVVFAILSKEFLTQANWYATSLYGSEYLPLAAGELLVIVTGGMDLAVGAELGFSGMVGGLVMQTMFLNRFWSGPGELVIGAIVCVATGAFLGAVNALVITRLRISPFIATLGMLGLAAGASQIIDSGNDYIQFPTALGSFGTYSLFGQWAPVPVVVAILSVLLVAFILTQTTFGAHLFAIGSLRSAAERTGVPVVRRLVTAYVLCGALAGVAGFLVLARFSTASPLNGQDDELVAIAAVVIGGASLFGGVGSALGAFIGTTIISVLTTGLILAGVSSFWEESALGVIIIVAVYLEQGKEQVMQRLTRVRYRLGTGASLK